MLAPTGSMRVETRAARDMRGKLIRGFFGLFPSWWRHKVSFTISLSITASALLIYVFTFVGERPTPIFEFIQRLELNALDTRFRYRDRKSVV